MKIKGAVGISVLLCGGIIAGYWYHSHPKTKAPAVNARHAKPAVSTANVRDPNMEYKSEERELPAGNLKALLAELQQEGWTVQSYSVPVKKEDGKFYSRVTLQKPKQ